MSMRIALVGNPNCGKTTLFNALTGSNQFVGNWPGVTVEKKEGKLKKHDGVTITDLPGIYSLSPYTLEEVVARNCLIGESPDAVLNIIDGTNLERNLYLTTQLTELGIPGIIASRTIENERDRRMTIMTTTFIPCGAKVPFISMVAGAIKREMNNAKWTWFAIGYQCGLAYAAALMVNQIGSAFTGSLNVIGLLAAVVILVGMIYMLFRPYKEATKLTAKMNLKTAK